MGVLIRDFHADYSANYDGKYDSVYNVVRKKTQEGYVEGCYIYARRWGAYINDIIPSSYRMLDITISIFGAKYEGNQEEYSRVLSIGNTTKKVDVFVRKSQEENMSYVEVVTTDGNNVYTATSENVDMHNYPQTDLCLTIDTNNGNCSGLYNGTVLLFGSLITTEEETTLTENGVAIYIDIQSKVTIAGEYCAITGTKINCDSTCVFNLPLLHNNPMWEYISNNDMIAVGDKSRFPIKRNVPVDKVIS